MNPPMSGPAATAAPGHGADDGECGDAVAALVVVGDECGDRGDDEHRAEPLDDRPAEEQHAHVRGDRRGSRADGVDDRADDERAAPAPDVSELGAEQHQRGHRERVERDRGLHRRHGAVEVRDDCRDRDVHHRAVEHHHELRRSEDQHDEPLLHCCSLPGDRSAMAISAHSIPRPRPVPHLAELTGGGAV